MAQPIDRARLAPEPRHERLIDRERRLEDLERFLAAECDVFGEIDLAHSTASQLAQDAPAIMKDRADHRRVNRSYHRRPAAAIMSAQSRHNALMRWIALGLVGVMLAGCPLGSNTVDCGGGFMCPQGLACAAPGYCGESA